MSLLCYADRIPNILGIGIFDYTDPKFVVDNSCDPLLMESTYV